MIKARRLWACLLTSGTFASEAFAQELPPPPAQPAPAPPAAPELPAPPSPTPNAPPPAPPAAAPAPPSADAGFQAGGSVSFGASSFASPGNGEEDEGYRRASLRVENALNGSTGLMHVIQAGSAAPGTFRVSLLGSYFHGSGFLCNGSDCPPRTADAQRASDDVSRVGAHLGISATLLPFLEANFGFHSYATSDDQGNPELLQALGDTNLGLKAFLPYAPDRVFSFGGAADLWLLNGTGSVGIDGAGTSLGLRALATADLSNRRDANERIPVRIHANLGYFLNNSGELISDTEQRRNRPISRIERFSLNINRVDSLNLGLGVEGAFERVRPFVEWSLDVPVNRQGYTCNATRAAAAGDGCLGENAGFSTTPSRLTVGARFYPWNENLALLAAVDIGTGATYDFIEEVSPEMPWNAYLGVAFAVDTQPNVVVQRVEVEKQAALPVSVERYATGTVVDKSGGGPIANATLRFDGRNLTGMITAEDGSFRTPNLEPGAYMLNVAAPGYRAAQCPVFIPGAGVAPGPGTGAAGGEPLGNAPLAGGTPTIAPSGATIVTVQCQLEAMPKVGNVIGGVVDAETNQPVGNVKVKIADRLNRELELTSDTAGAFRFENVPPGPVRITVTAPNYLTSVTELEIQPREDVRAHISINKRPKQANVVVAGAEVKLKKQVHFQTDSAEILPDSLAILEELADLLKTRTDLKSVEVQGHTDNTGTAAYNLRLSQERAEAVVAQLERLGVDRSRLVAKGYGQEKPIVPNTSDAGRARNRRVQVIITKKE